MWKPGRGGGRGDPQRQEVYPKAWILTLSIHLIGSVQNTSESLLSVERTGQSYGAHSACLSVP